MNDAKAATMTASPFCLGSLRLPPVKNNAAGVRSLVVGDNRTDSDEQCDPRVAEKQEHPKQTKLTMASALVLEDFQ